MFNSTLLTALFTGFSLGFSLILAIGAQNAFVLRQGLRRQYVLPVVLFCSVSDTLLIILGVSGLSLLVADIAEKFAPVMFGVAALWLAGYGALRIKSAFKSVESIYVEDRAAGSLKMALFTAAMLTYANPHVYLDTVVLVGMVSLQFSGAEKIAYGVGAAIASFFFFFALGYGGSLLAPLIKRGYGMRILDLVIALMMFLLAFGLVRAGGWFGS